MSIISVSIVIISVVWKIMVITISKVSEGRVETNSPARTPVITSIKIIRTIGTPIRVVEPSVIETPITKTTSVKTIPGIVIH
jgi:hypothetical protein